MRIDWKEYLKQFDLIYEMQSRIWKDGFPLGNGSLGALAYDPFHLEWVINKNDVWDYRHPKFKRHTMDEMRQIVADDRDYLTEMGKENLSEIGLYPSPKTCGQLRIRFGHDAVYSPGHRITKRLSLYDGAVQTNLDKHLSHPRVTSFVCQEEDILVVQVRDVSTMVAFHNNVDLHRVPDALMPDPTLGADGDLIWIEQPFHDGFHKNFRYVMMAKVVPTGGMAYADMFRETVVEKWWFTINPSKSVTSKLEGEYAVAPVAGDFDIYLTVVTSLESDDPLDTARKRLEAAAEKGSQKLHEENCRWWADFWGKSYVGFDDTALEQLWYLSLYNIATALRGTPVGALFGLTFGPVDTPSQTLPWMGHYTGDYNFQSPITPVFRVNYPELADGSFRTVLMQLPGAKRNAERLYDLPGAFYPLSSDPTGEEVTNGPYRFCQGTGPYWCVFLWWHYLYTGDKDYLREVSYPIIRDVATFFTNYLQWHEDEDLYHLEISQNPELMYVKYPDPVDTLVFLKYTLKATIQAAEILGVDNDLARKCKHVLDHYPSYPQDGQEIVPLKGLPANHINHFRVMAGLFPCGEFDPETAPEWYDACRATVDRMDLLMRRYACNNGWIRGWSGATYHIGVSACRLEDKAMAWDYMEDMLKTNIRPNGLVNHNAVFLADCAQSEPNVANIPDMEFLQDLDPDPLRAVEIMNGRLEECTTENLDCRDGLCPALEGSSIFLLHTAEMLLQSHNGVLRLFPALPDERDAEFIDLRAEGPTLVSAQRFNGEVTFVHIKALADVSWKVKNPWRGDAIWQLKSGSTPEQVKTAKYLELELAAGEEVTLAFCQENLSGIELIKPRNGEQAQARMMKFSDGMVMWLGKPQPSLYYASLEAARRGEQ